MAKPKELRVNHEPVDEDIANSLTDEEKAWLRSWNRHDEIPDEEAPREADADESEEDSAGYGEYTVPELRDLLKSRDLPTGGNKDELVARLEEDDESEDDSEE